MAQPQTQDPREAGERPPFPKQEQEAPGREAEMSPRPDYGVESYKGHGRLKDRVAFAQLTSPCATPYVSSDARRCWR